MDLPQRVLATEIGIHTGNLNRWLSGRLNPSLKAMILMDEAIERLQAFIDGEET